jgi:hypothetical protein
LANVEQKGPKRGETSRNLVFLLLFSLIPNKSKKSYNFPTDIEKDSFVSEAQMPSKRENFYGAPIFQRTGRKGLPRVGNTDLQIAENPAEPIFCPFKVETLLKTLVSTHVVK